MSLMYIYNPGGTKLNVKPIHTSIIICEKHVSQFNIYFILRSTYYNFTGTEFIWEASVSASVTSRGIQVPKSAYAGGLVKADQKRFCNADD